jgi:alpha-tubulin suppressor-like RCC1 family protein
MQVAVSELQDNGSHALILDLKGRVWSMGSNTFGGLGREGGEQIMPVPGLPGTVRNVTVSYGTSAAVLNNGELWVWGRNLQHILGQTPVPIPTRLPVPEPVVQVAIGTAYGTCHVLAVTRDGSVYGTGSNAFYQLGMDRNTPDKAYRIFTRMYSRERVIKAAAGSLYSILLLSTGRLVGCGHTFSGELGCGQVIYTRKRLTPVFKSLGPILDVEARHQSTAVITRQGQLYLCGSNTVGWEHRSPKRVEVDEPIVSCALTNCFGVVFIKTESGTLGRYCGSTVVTL